MIIIGINGSPNLEGNTASMLNVALEEAAQTGAQVHLLQVNQLMSKIKVPYCIACSNPCTGKCYQGTALEEAFALLKQADGIIMGSPVYFCTVSAQLKAFWDKTRMLRGSKALLNVVGAALAVGAARFGGQETTISAIHDMMLCQGMTVVGDGYVQDDAGHQGACAQRMAMDDQNAILRTKILARRVAELAQATVALREHRL